MTKPPETSDMAALLQIMAQLRDREAGCPWDIEQSYATIAPYTIEEAYEVADAIARDDMGDLRDELGDLLFQVVFHARMGKERGAFDFDAVATAIVDKLERRHPHVFGGETIATSEEQSVAWESHKEAERAARAEGRLKSALDRVHGGRPALERATELQRAAASRGFDWRDADGVMPKLREELGELEHALSQEDGNEQAAEELGDLLFTCANLARHLGIDAAGALRRANAKFERRFRCMERDFVQRGESLEEATPEQMDASWESAKRREDSGTRSP